MKKNGRMTKKGRFKDDELKKNGTPDPLLIVFGMNLKNI